MIKVTAAAAQAIKASMQQGQIDPYWGLRLAAKKMPDGSLQYGMGFDEIIEEDMLFRSEGVEIIIKPEYFTLLDGLVIDFDTLDSGEKSFLFLNPNDPNYQPPGPKEDSLGEENKGNCGCGPSGCG